MARGLAIGLRPHGRSAPPQAHRIVPGSRPGHGWLLVMACALLLGASTMAQAVRPVSAGGEGTGAETPRVRRVFILHSFGRAFEPFHTVSSDFRTELALQSAAPIEFLEASFETSLYAEGGSETPFVDYLRALFAERPADLLVLIGAPAMHFVQRHREALFPGVPVLVVAADKRRLSDGQLGGNATAVGISLDLPGIVENMVRLLPSTTTIAVVTGNSPFERFWLTEFRRDFQHFADRLRFEWLNELSFEEIRRRLAGLPPDAAILYALMLVDAAGVPYEQERALDVLRRDSNAPIFGILDHQVGRGIVGGPSVSVPRREPGVSPRGAPDPQRRARGQHPARLLRVDDTSLRLARIDALEDQRTATAARQHRTVETAEPVAALPVAHHRSAGDHRAPGHVHHGLAPPTSAATSGRGGAS